MQIYGRLTGVLMLLVFVALLCIGTFHFGVG